MNKPGHYFCSFCNDVKFMRFTERYERCPDCHNYSCMWVGETKQPDKMDPEQATARFQELKNSIPKL